MDEVSTYLYVLGKSLEARARGDVDLEDSLLDQLDSIWFSLNESDRLAASEAVKQYVKLNPDL